MIRSPVQFTAQPYHYNKSHSVLFQNMSIPPREESEFGFQSRRSSLRLYWVDQVINSHKLSNWICYKLLKGIYEAINTEKKPFKNMFICFMFAFRFLFHFFRTIRENKSFPREESRARESCKGSYHSKTDPQIRAICWVKCSSPFITCELQCFRN